MKHVPHVFGNEFVVIQKQTVCHSESHTGIVCPNGGFATPAPNIFLFNLILNVIESILNVIISFGIVLLELSACAKSIRNGHAQNWSNSTRLSKRKVELRGIEVFFFILDHLAENLGKAFSIGVFFIKGRIDRKGFRRESWIKFLIKVSVFFF